MRAATLTIRCWPSLWASLQSNSEEFRTWWADHRVVERRDGIKRLDHPLVGRLDIRYEALAVTGEPDQTLFIYTTEPGSESESKLRTLAGWVYGDTRCAGPSPGTRRTLGRTQDPRPDAGAAGR